LKIEPLHKAKRKTVVAGALLLFVIIYSSLYYCSKPEQFIYDNPFDTLNPGTQGDPFALAATIGEGGILLSWNAVSLPSITGYKIFRKDTDETDFSVIGDTTAIRFIDINIRNGNSYRYKVAAFDKDSIQTGLSSIAGVTVNTAPVININNSELYTSSRSVLLTILAQTAVEMRISNYADFTGSTWEAYSTTKGWELITGEDVKYVYLQVKYDNDSLSAVSSDDILPMPINPDITINGDSLYTSKRNVILNLSAAGTNLKIKVSEDSTFTGVLWDDYTEIMSFTFSPGEGKKKIFARVQNDFDIESSLISDDITFDQTPPVVVFSLSSDTLFTSPFELRGTASDNLSGIEIVEISFDNGENFQSCQGTTSWSYNWQNITRGSFQIVIRVLDGAHNKYISAPADTVYALPVSPVLTTVAADPLEISADGSSTSTIKVIPKDFNGNNLGADLLVSLNATKGIFPDTVTYNSSDRSYSQLLQSSTVSGTAEVSVWVNGVSITNKAEIEFKFVFEPELVLVPADTFKMGDNFNEGYANELPVHNVYLNSYYIGKYEVTNEEYKRFIDDEGYTNSSYWNNGGFGDYGSQPFYWNDAAYSGGGISGNEQFPVAGISWYEASAFCSWLSDGTGDTYRLPTEAEWEKAARGTDQRRYPWGGSSANLQSDIDGSYTNYLNSGDSYDDGLTPAGFYNGTTHNGFSTNSNASYYGIFDMAGNIFEWCLDWYSSGYYSDSPVSNPSGPDTGFLKVVRGGSWDTGSEYLLRSAYRGYNVPAGRYNNVGFRIVREE